MSNTEPKKITTNIKFKKPNKPTSKNKLLKKEFRKCPFHCPTPEKRSVNVSIKALKMDGLFEQKSIENK